jgi:hypothetical protein
MTGSFVPLRRIAALSVAITLFAAPTVSAQTPEVAQSSAVPATTGLLSPAAFARLVQRPPADAIPASVVKVPSRFDLLRQATAAMAREARATSVKAPQQKSWASRHKTALIVWSAIAGGLAIVYVCASSFCGLD